VVWNLDVGSQLAKIKNFLLENEIRKREIEREW